MFQVFPQQNPQKVLQHFFETEVTQSIKALKSRQISCYSDSIQKGDFCNHTVNKKLSSATKRED